MVAMQQEVVGYPISEATHAECRRSSIFGVSALKLSLLAKSVILPLILRIVHQIWHISEIHSINDHGPSAPPAHRDSNRIPRVLPHNEHIAVRGCSADSCAAFHTAAPKAEECRPLTAVPTGEVAAKFVVKSNHDLVDLAL